MATFIRAMEDSAFIEYNEFTIIDPDGGDDPDAKPCAQSWDERDIRGDWLDAADNMIMINSAYCTHHTRIRFELWSSDPGLKSEQLPDTDQTTALFYSSSGSVMVEEMFGDDDHELFELGPPRQRWQVRGYQKMLVPPGHFPESLDEELESYTFQFWPSA